MASDTTELILTLGFLLLVGLVVAGLGRRVGVPQVTLLILAGMALGPSGLGVLPEQIGDWYPVISDLALLMVGFLLGRHLEGYLLRAHGRKLLGFSLGTVIGAAAVVAVLLLAGGAPLPLALVLAGIAPASAPAAILLVVEESGGRGSYTQTMLALVAINNALALAVFDLLLSGAEALGSGGAVDPLLSGGRALGGALLVGILVGIPAALVVPRVRTGEPMQLAVLGMVLACGGLALWLEASYLLAAIVLGAVLMNAPGGDRRPFETVESIDWPFWVLFFIVTGARAHPEELLALGLVGVLYVVGRVAGLVGGAWIGGVMGSAPRLHRQWMGPAILPQAGVALGMALAAGHGLPDWGDTIMTVVVASTVLFELMGPVVTRLGLSRTGEAAPKYRT